MKVLKFGGTSVGSAESIRKVADIVKEYNQKNITICIICSAVSGITNLLITSAEAATKNDDSFQEPFRAIKNKHEEVIKGLFPNGNAQLLEEVNILHSELLNLFKGINLLKELSKRTKDLVVSFGERTSSVIIAAYLNQIGVHATPLDARSIIKTNDNFGNAKVNFAVTNQNIRNHFANCKTLQVITGFISSNSLGETTTLGRGGSDYTVSIIGAALEAEEIEIWTDVDGVMTADPRNVKRAFSQPLLTYTEAMELSHFGAKVIYPPTIQPAMEKNIPIRIRNTFNPGFNGTLINGVGEKEEFLIKGISSIKEVTLLSIIGSGLIGVSGISSRLFSALAKDGISVILITQASSEYTICFAVSPEDSQKAKDAILYEFEREIANKEINKISVEENLSVLAIVGDNMLNTIGVSGKLFSALGKNGINIKAIAQGSSERNISIVIYQSDLNKALNTVHESLFLSNLKTLNVFVIGVGLIGSTLLEQIQNQASYLEKKKQLKINIISVANSKKMLFNTDGIHLPQWKKQMNETGKQSNIKEFVKEMIDLNLPNSVFVDNASNKEIIEYYEEILSSNISIVTPNKLTNSGTHNRYKLLQDICFKKGVKFLYETNVGAGLPVISTLNDLKFSGDEILKIEGVLSGTLSYIFNSFVAGTKFSDIVLRAKEKGFTEPDPRDDLNGMDVARKILILSRESEVQMELEDVELTNILPESCRNAKGLDEFFKELKKHDGHFESIRSNAHKEGKVLRFMATMENGKAVVDLKSVGSEHPFYSLSGSDNMIAFTTKRYYERPLVIKGPGAGAEVTAAGVFAEIISISNYLS